MNSHANAALEGTSQPFSQSTARRIAEELFREKSQWKTRDLSEQIVELHRKRGGFIPPNGAGYMIRRALQNLKEDRLIVSPLRLAGCGGAMA